MKSAPLFIICLLSFALLIQNTCPFGAAGKTALNALGKDCPMKHRVVVSNDVQENLVPNISTDHFPHFVFDVPEALHSFQARPITPERPVRAIGYQDALPDELLRPPRPLMI